VQQPNEELPKLVDNVDFSRFEGQLEAGVETMRLRSDLTNEALSWFASIKQMKMKNR
jgi:hypothetical protein